MNILLRLLRNRVCCFSSRHAFLDAIQRLCGVFFLSRWLYDSRSRPVFEQRLEIRRNTFLNSMCLMAGPSALCCMELEPENLPPDAAARFRLEDRCEAHGGAVLVAAEVLG